MYLQYTILSTNRESIRLPARIAKLRLAMRAGTLGLSKIGGSTFGLGVRAAGYGGSWHADATVWIHLFMAVSGPLPGSEAGIDPQLRVVLNSFSF
jgi:hypothetical protein